MSSLSKLGTYSTGPLKRILEFSDTQSLTTIATTCKSLYQDSSTEITIRVEKIKAEIRNSLQSIHKPGTKETQCNSFFSTILNSKNYLRLPEENRNEILLLFLPIINSMSRWEREHREQRGETGWGVSLNFHELYEDPVFTEKNLFLRSQDVLQEARVLALARLVCSSDRNQNGVLSLLSSDIQVIINYGAKNELKRALKIIKAHIIKISSYDKSGNLPLSNTHFNQIKCALKNSIQKIDARDTYLTFFTYLSRIISICMWTLGLAGLMYLTINNLAINTWHIENIGAWIGVSIGSFTVNVTITLLANCFFCRLISYCDHKYTTRTRLYINPNWRPAHSPYARMTCKEFFKDVFYPPSKEAKWLKKNCSIFTPTTSYAKINMRLLRDYRCSWMV